MSERWRRIAAAILGLGYCLQAVAESEFEFKGYYKNLFAVSQTPQPENAGFALDLNRLRLELRDHPSEWFAYDLEYDNEGLLGSYLHTQAFQQQKAAEDAGNYWDLDNAYVDHRSIYLHQRLYRGFVRLQHRDTTVYLGRQRIAWGSGRIWNPTDLLNPYNPAQLEPAERPGADAILVDQAFSALTSLSAVYAPQRNAPDSWALRYRTNAADTDLIVMAGRFRGDDVGGVDFSGRLGEAGTYGEGAYTRPMTGSDYVRAVTGIEYAFVNTLTVSIELYWNGAGAGDTAHYDRAALAAGQIQNLGRRYVGGRLRYEFTPLLRTEDLAIANGDDGSYLLSPTLIYSLTANWDVGGGVQLVGGSRDSEYGGDHDLYFVYVQWFF